MRWNDKVQYWLLSRNCTLGTMLYIIWTHERKAVVLVYLKSSLPNLTSIKWRRWKCCLFHWFWWHYIRFVWESQHRNGRDELFIRYVYVRNIKIFISQWKVCHLNFLSFWAYITILTLLLLYLSLYWLSWGGNDNIIKRLHARICLPKEKKKSNLNSKATQLKWLFML